MPVRIDQMETTVELTTPDAPRSAESGDSRGVERSGAGTDLSRLIGRVVAEELDQFLRNRGMK